MKYTESLNNNLRPNNLPLGFVLSVYLSVYPIHPLGFLLSVYLSQFLHGFEISTSSFEFDFGNCLESDLSSSSS